MTLKKKQPLKFFRRIKRRPRSPLLDSFKLEKNNSHSTEDTVSHRNKDIVPHWARRRSIRPSFAHLDYFYEKIELMVQSANGTIYTVINCFEKLL